MAVKTEKKAEAAPVQKYIELSGAKRYVAPGGALYEAGVAYPVKDDAQLADFLSHENEGKRMFRLYKEPVKSVKQVDGISVPVAPLPTATSKEVVSTAADANPNPTGRIDIGDESELAGIVPPAGATVEV